MADITKIQPMGDSTQYTLGARYLTHTPNNTTTFLRGDNTWSDTLTTTLNLTPPSGEGGEIHLNASTAQTTHNGIILDNCNGTFRVFGIPSADGTTKTGVGTPLEINPYAKTITGGYTITGTLNGNASTATNADKVDNLHARDLLRVYYKNTDLSSTENVATDHYLYAVGDTGGWATTSTKPSGMDNAFSILHVHLHSGNYAMQLGFGGTTSQLYFRNAYNATSFSAWKTVLDSSNYTTYAAAASHSHAYVAKSGDTMTGRLSICCSENPPGNTPNLANIELREAKRLTTDSSLAHSSANSPRLGFHWGGRYWAQLALFDSRFRFYNADLSGYYGVQASAVYGAVWNDYAEMRNVPEANIFEEKENIRNIKLAGRCVREVGDDTMVLSTERMQPGCKIISDTFGFNIGETDDCKTPIAVSGRALVYIYEGREAARNYIGQPVCSGPDGTISIMTDEEYAAKGYCCVGTISAVPEYETWGSGNVQVDGRIWIYVR